MEQDGLKKKLFFLLWGVVFSVVAATGPAAAGQAGLDQTKVEAARAFFKGKSLVFVVPYAPGGGYDAKARVMAPFLEKYLPGVKVLVKNVPGAGSMVATNQLYVTKPNGLTIAILSGVGVVANQLGGVKVARYDATKFNYLGRVAAERRVLIAGMGSKIKDLDSLLHSPVPVKQALTGPGSGSYAISQLVLRALGFPREEVTGYESSAAAEMGVIRGETDTHFASENAALPLIERGDMRPIFQLAPVNIEGLDNIPNLLTKDVEKLNLAEGPLRRIELAGGMMALGYIIGAPPGIAPERLFVLEEAVQKTIRNPEFVAICKKTGASPTVDPLTGAEVRALVDKFLNISPDLKAEVQQLMKPKK